MAKIDEQINAKATMFGDMAKGGYFRVYEATDYKGIGISVRAETRKSPPETTIVYNGVDYETSSAAIAAWKADHKEEKNGDHPDNR